MRQSILEDGTRVTADRAKDKEGPFLCPLCLGELTLVVSSEKSRKKSHFRHKPGSPANCMGKSNKKQ